MTESPGQPFDATLPSPLLSVAQMAASASGSVVTGSGLTRDQQAAYIRTSVEDRLLAELRSSDPPSLVVIGGAAGGGKSLIIDRLLDGGTAEFGRVIRDATHAETPDQEQVERLEDFFAPFADGEPRHEGRPQLIALNTGMALKFFIDSRRLRGGSFRFHHLEAVIRSRLGVPQAPDGIPGPTGWLESAILVVNLDHRPTSGGGDLLFRKMLSLLDPADPDGLLRGAERCGTCTITDWCFPRTNLELLSSEPVADVLDRQVAELALRRGRDYTPRALWDLVAELVLGGLDPAAGDPCLAVARVRQKADVTGVFRGLLPYHGFREDPSAPDTGIVAELAEADPTLLPHPRVHDFVANAGLSAEENARSYARSLGDRTGRGRRAIGLVSDAIASGRITPVGGRLLARAAWLAGELPLDSADIERFRDAIAAVRGERSAASRADVLEQIAGGLNAGFAIQAGPEYFYPTEKVARATSISVKIDLIGDPETALCIDLRDDSTLQANPRGCAITSYRPLHFEIEIAGSTVSITMPLWSILLEAAEGKNPSSVDLERFHALRRALERAGKHASQEETRPLLVSDTRTGRRFRIAPQRILGEQILRATEVMAS